MKLNKRYVRGIRENLSFYISATVLTVVTLLLYFLFVISGNAIIKFGDEFFARNHLEDAHFSTYLPISDEDMENLKEKYSLELEAQHYINLETDGVTARIFERTEEVDLYEITVGRDVAADDEIVISEGYSVANDVNIGDKMKIGEDEYKVVGFMQRPDYLYMLENEDDSYKNISTFYLCYMTDDAFEHLNAAGVQYLVRYSDDSDTSGFRKEVHEKFYMRSYSSSEDNPRITMVDEQAQMFIVMAYLMLCILPLVAVALISIIISRKVKSEQRMIGTLSAMGYKKGTLMRHYAGFAVIPGLVGGILTTVIVLIIAQPFAELCLADYEPMRIKGEVDVAEAVLGIVIPTAMYALAALATVRKLLKKDTVLLLNGNADGDKKRMKRILAGKNISFRVKFAVRSLLGNPARSFVVLLGVFLGSLIMLLALAFFDSINNMSDNAADDVGSFEHEYILGELLTENPYGGESMLVSAVENADGILVSVIGTTSGNPYINMNDKNGDAVDLEDGYYITSLAELALDWHEGDRVTVYNPLSLKENEIEIAGVIQNNVQKCIVTSKSYAAELTGLDENQFNCIISDRSLDIPEEKVSQEVKASAINDQVKTMTEQMGFMLWTIVILGVIICIASVYVAVNMMVTESRSNISMLKVLGYKNGQINKIVLNVHHILLPIGILLSVPATYAACDAFFKMMVSYGVMLIDSYIAPRSYVISIWLTVLCYFASLMLVRRKIRSVNMVESLKDNRE